MPSSQDNETRDYGFADRALALRKRTGLTQRELGALVGVSEKAIGAWESGLSYPSVERLEQLIALSLDRGALTPGQEEEDAKALWDTVRAHAPRRTSAFDPHWYASLPGATTAAVIPAAVGTPASPSRRHDWGEAPEVPILQGRSRELTTLARWVSDQDCRVVEVLGAGGIGKTTLASQLAHDLASDFAVVYWRSLRNALTIEEWLSGAIGTLSAGQVPVPTGYDAQVGLLLELLHERPALLVLDNVETSLEPGASEVRYRPGHEGYGEALQRLAEGAHRGTLLLTSREQPLPADDIRVRVLHLEGLGVDAGRELLSSRQLTGDKRDWETLVERYGGNPLALRIVGETIRTVFGGNLTGFLEQETAVFGGIRQLLNEQVARLSPLEESVLTWLAVEREPVGFAEIVADLGPGVARGEAVEVVEALLRRSMLETDGNGVFTVQPVVLEDATTRLIETVAGEVLRAEPRLLVHVALVKATAKEYVRDAQEHLIALPLLERLHSSLGSSDVVEQQLLKLLQMWRGRPLEEQGYGPGNVVNLLRLLRGSLTELDLSHLALRQIYLQGVNAEGADLTESHVTEVLMDESFTFPSAVALSADGAYLAMGTSTGEVAVRRVADRTLLVSMQGHSGPVLGMALSSDGQVLATSSFDGTVKLWNASNGRLLSVLEGHVTGAWGVALSADGHLLASGGQDAMVKLWDVTDERLRATLPGHTGAVRSVALSADGHLLATGGEDGTVRLWETDGGRSLITLPGHTGGVWRLALSADGNVAATTGQDGMVKLWDTASGGLLVTLQDRSEPVWRVALSGDGRMVAGSGQNGRIHLWDVRSGKLLGTLQGHHGGVPGVTLSLDGRLLATCGEDGTVKLWETETGRLLANLQGQANGIWDVAMSLDGQAVVAGAQDGTVRLWEAESGRLLSTLRGHAGGVQGVALSGDGRLIASGGQDATARLWDTLDGANLEVRGSERRYDRMDITGLTGVTDAERANLRALGAVERARNAAPSTTGDNGAPKPQSKPSPDSSFPDGSTRPPTNLPPARTSFVGRAADRAALSQALDPREQNEKRLITLSGVAGCGKTRLALAVGDMVRDAYKDGAWLVELASLPTDTSADVTNVAAATLSALALDETPGIGAKETLVTRLQSKQALLILDNCEHVAAACGTLATILLDACPGLRILATSQIPLRAVEEVVWPVAPLSVPELVTGTPTSAYLQLLGESDAVKLFVERAQAVQPGFDLRPATAESVATICRRLDGLPLALELAAARLNVIPVEEILARLDDRLRLLRRGGRTSSGRHHTMQATLDWSYSLLDRHEQTLLRRLAVFAGGWELVGAEEVCGGDDLAPESILELLDELLERSLVYIQSDGNFPRYRMLETIQQYGLQHLEHAGETTSTRERHLLWCTTLAERAAPALLGPAQAEWLSRLEREHDNLRAALRWAVDRERSTLAVRLAAGLCHFWRGRRRHLREGRRWLTAVLALPPEKGDPASMAARANALEGAAWLAEDEHDFAQASSLFSQSEDLHRALGQGERGAGLLINAAMEARAGGNYVRATSLLEETLAEQRTRGNHETIKGGGIGLTLSRLALVLAEQGSYARATSLYEECVALHRELGDREGEGYALLGLGDVARDLGDIGRVRLYCEETLSLFRDLGHTLAGFSLNNLALADYLDGDLASAARRAEESASLFRDQQADPSLGEVLVTLGRVRGATGEAAAAWTYLTEALALARAKGPRIVVAAALEDLGVQAVRQALDRNGVCLLAASAALRKSMGTPARPADRPVIDDALSKARARLDDSAFAEAWIAGQTHPIEEVVLESNTVPVPGV